MTDALLTTKLYVPPPRSGHIPRKRLIERLNTGLEQQHILVSAPAGFGKSTLLSFWISQFGSERPVAWLSIDEGDNDLTRFLTYLISALQTLSSEIGQGALVTLKSQGAVNPEAILTNIINDIAEANEEVILVLDDYHVIESQQIDQAITFLLDNPPPHFHLVIATRIDPSLPLSRLRGRGQLTDIRADNLRFTMEEAATFLNQVMGLNLSAEDVDALEKRTEGWIAGLQLAAISMQGFDNSNDMTAFVNRFTGGDRYIQDYLADEVLQQRPEGTREFLLQTSILNRLSEPLCDAVTGKKGSQAILENLEDSNLFIVPLDNERQWYRYHHLFADLLRQRLRQNYQEQIPTLHRRASQWYEQQEIPSDAIRHALAANDSERAAVASLDSS